MSQLSFHWILSAGKVLSVAELERRHNDNLIDTIFLVLVRDYKFEMTLACLLRIKIEIAFRFKTICSLISRDSFAFLFLFNCLKTCLIHYVYCYSLILALLKAFLLQFDLLGFIKWMSMNLKEKKKLKKFIWMYRY